MRNLLLTISLLAFSASTLALSYTKEVSEKQLQKTVQAMMPITQKNTLVSVTVKNPVIDLPKETNKVVLKSDFDASAIGGIKGNGTMNVAGNVVYDKERGAFFLQNIEVLDFKSDKIGDSYKDIVKTLAQQVLNTTLKNNPIYTLDTNSTEGKLAKATLKSVKVKDEKLLLKMGL